jgi:flagellar protein FliS
MNAYMNQYQKNQILTASQEQLLIMLYDGAIRFCRKAIKASENGDLVKKLEAISKTVAIITEFSDSLDHEVGGEIAEELDALYYFMLRELNSARSDETGAFLRTVESMLLDLRQTWVQAIEIAKREQGYLAQQNDNESASQPPTESRLNSAG